MQLLLDTHVLLWWLSDDPGLDSTVRAVIADPESDVAVSAASAWEIGIKRALGKLDVPDDLEELLAHHSFSPLPITIPHAVRAGELPFLHRDPFDRMLVAQAQLEELTLVTNDDRVRRYDVRTLGGVGT